MHGVTHSIWIDVTAAGSVALPMAPLVFPGQSPMPFTPSLFQLLMNQLGNPKQPQGQGQPLTVHPHLMLSYQHFMQVLVMCTCLKDVWSVAVSAAQLDAVISAVHAGADGTIAEPPLGYVQSSSGSALTDFMSINQLILIVTCLSLCWHSCTTNGQLLPV